MYRKSYIFHPVFTYEATWKARVCSYTADGERISTACNMLIALDQRYGEELGISRLPPVCLDTSRAGCSSKARLLGVICYKNSFEEVAFVVVEFAYGFS